jgi:hypothetical protein
MRELRSQTICRCITMVLQEHNRDTESQRSSNLDWAKALSALPLPRLTSDNAPLQMAMSCPRQKPLTFAHIPKAEVTQ